MGLDQNCVQWRDFVLAMLVMIIYVLILLNRMFYKYTKLKTHFLSFIFIRVSPLIQLTLKNFAFRHSSASCL